MLLEGPAIEPLLAQVRDEYGSGVRIISADKVRSGGFGGFFAKQHYELSVEVPDNNEERTNMAARKAPAPAPEEPADSLEQLLARAESNDRIAPEEPPPADPPEPAVASEKQAGRDAGMEDTEAAAGRRDLSENAAAFAELMAGLDAANHIATSVPHRPSPRPKLGPGQATTEDTPTVRPFRPATATGSPINAGGGLRPLPPVPSLAELMGGLGVSETETPAFQPAKPPPTPARSAAAAYGLNQPAVKEEEPAAPPVLRPVHTDPVIRNLISVGMPEAMAAQITGGDTYAGVLTALAARPAAPGIPDGAGEILVLAGDLAHAVPIGKELLAQTGTDQSHLLLAGASAAGTGLHSSRVIPDPKSAAARAEKLQATDAPWVVVLDAPVGGTDPIWVNDMCDALGATAVWAVVDATRKTADTARHLRTLGEVEALIVHSVDLTADPATVLGLDLPIYSLDGKPATPHAWAAMLCARIAADVMPVAAAPRRQARSPR
ncbi:MAG TPA: hypothetical protein VFH03_01785 [Actinoplanes sp.]|nr:hypothetical protein [Actinoplanes sp.]